MHALNENLRMAKPNSATLALNILQQSFTLSISVPHSVKNKGH